VLVHVIETVITSLGFPLADPSVAWRMKPCSLIALIALSLLSSPEALSPLLQKPSNQLRSASAQEEM